MAAETAEIERWYRHLFSLAAGLECPEQDMDRLVAACQETGLPSSDVSAVHWTGHEQADGGRHYDLEVVPKPGLPTTPRFHVTVDVTRKR